MTQTCDVMILAAHPDDAEFGASGTVARWTNEDREVVYVICYLLFPFYPVVAYFVRTKGNFAFAGVFPSHSFRGGLHPATAPA